MGESMIVAEEHISLLGRLEEVERAVIQDTIFKVLGAFH